MKVWITRNILRERIREESEGAYETAFKMVIGSASTNFLYPVYALCDHNEKIILIKKYTSEGIIWKAPTPKDISDLIEEQEKRKNWGPDRLL